MRPIILDPPARDRIAACVAYAEAHPIPVADILRSAAESGSGRSVGDDPGRVVDIDFGVRCVYSVEECLRYDDGTFGWVRHISISVNTPGKTINPVAADEISALFGFTAGELAPDTNVYLEHFGPYAALNIIQECAAPVHDVGADAMIVPNSPLPARSPRMEAAAGQGKPATSTEGTSHVDSDDNERDERHQSHRETHGGQSA